MQIVNWLSFVKHWNLFDSDNHVHQSRNKRGNKSIHALFEGWVGLMVPWPGRVLYCESTLYMYIIVLWASWRSHNCYVYSMFSHRFAITEWLWMETKAEKLTIWLICSPLMKLLTCVRMRLEFLNCLATCYTKEISPWYIFL